MFHTMNISPTEGHCTLEPQPHHPHSLQRVALRAPEFEESTKQATAAALTTTIQTRRILRSNPLCILRAQTQLIMPALKDTELVRPKNRLASFKKHLHPTICRNLPKCKRRSALLAQNTVELPSILATTHGMFTTPK